MTEIERKAKELVDYLRFEWEEGRWNGPDYMDKIMSALRSQAKEAREKALEDAERAVRNAPVNRHSKYTCCLENGLNASQIAQEAIRKLKEGV